MTISLAGLTVVNTRPAHQAQQLTDTLRSAGASVIDFPVIKIMPPSDQAILQSQLEKLGNVDIAIFISANAVEAGIAALGGAQNWPEKVSIAAVGRATATKLSSLGLEPSLVAPEPFNSEALLALPELQEMDGKHIMIFRGIGGREVLAETLRRRGAQVEYLEVYRRAIPNGDPVGLYQCWDENCLLLIVITSNEGLQNLFDMVDPIHRPDLLSTTLVVVSHRAIDKASELGFKTVPELSLNASNDAIVEAIYHWYANR